MQVLNKISIDMAKKTAPVVIHAMQGDENSRVVEAHLFLNSFPWNVPENATPSVAFKNIKDGHKGWYDKLPDGSKAISATGNSVLLTLSKSVVSSHGDVSVAIVFQDEKLNQLATFPFLVSVEQNPAFGDSIVNDYYNYSTMEEVSDAVEAALEQLDADKQAFLEDAAEALSVVHDAATEDAPAIVCEKTGSVISANDASDRLLKGLVLYGKTTQDGTPTPENPVDLVTAGASGTINTTVAGKNLFSGKVLNGYFVSNAWTKDSYNYSVYIPCKPSTSYTVSKKAGKRFAVAYAEELPVNTGDSVFGQMTDQTASSITIKTGETAKYLLAWVRNANVDTDITYKETMASIQIEESTTATAYEPYNGQTITAQTPNGLPGIPVTRVSGNYTDANGQQWICDTIDFATGIYTKRVETKVLTGAENWNQCSPATWYDYTYYLNTGNDGISGYNASEKYCLSNQYIPTSRASIQSVTTPDRCAIGASGREITFTSNCATAEEWKAELAQKYAAGNPVIIQYVRAKPIETPLSAEELAAYAALHTNKSNTTIYNDAGTGMKLQYVADTKIYIDNKFTELQNAILSSGANV